MESQAPVVLDKPPHPLRYRQLIVLVPWTGFVLSAPVVTSLALTEGQPWVFESGSAQLGAWVALALSVAAAVITMWRASLAARYTPVAPPPDADLVPITVVVPAYNEGRPVYDTLLALAHGDYPKDRLQILAVDDGSADDTFAWMQRAKRELGDLVELVRLPENRGKRHALAAGFARATGQVLVTIDSDSVVHPDALRHLVAPFIHNPRVGAVAGNVRVMDHQSDVWARMLDAAFTYSFEVVRAGQSVLGAVLCTPGAASAYRRDLVTAFLVEWRDQTFLGRPANIGEDRAMTNRILRAGFLVTYQSTALVETLVPSTFGAARRMLLRWARSNVRETLILLSFVFTRFRGRGVWGPRLFAVQGGAALVLGGVGFVSLLIALATHPLATVTAAASGTLIASAVPAVAYVVLRRRAPVWTFVHGLANVFLLLWITPWALLTAHHGGWLTRQLPQTAEAPASNARVGRESLAG